MKEGRDLDPILYPLVLAATVRIAAFLVLLAGSRAARGKESDGNVVGVGERDGLEGSSVDGWSSSGVEALMAVHS